MQSLARQGEQVGACFARLLKAFSSSGTSEKFSLQLPPRSVYDEYQRFQLWSSNLGLQRTGHASLDYMLQDTELVRQHTADLLDELEEYLNESKFVYSQSHRPLKSAQFVSMSLKSHFRLASVLKLYRLYIEAKQWPASFPVRQFLSKKT